MLDRWRRSIAKLVAPTRKSGTRGYAAAINSRLTSGFGNYANTSADSELGQSLTQLRARSRQLMRDAPYAKRARIVVVNNVIGSGVGMQCQVKNSRDELHQRINEAIEDAWEDWAPANSCHTGGALHFSELERTALSEVFTAGEVFLRKHYRPFGNSRIPFALELIESERLADEFHHPQAGGPSTKLGIELDTFGRPVAYFIRTVHPGEIRFTADQTVKYERVPASDIIHIRKVERWPQTRGEPWLHGVVRKLNDMDGYTEAEIIAARGAASYMGFIKTEDMDGPIGEPQSDGTEQLELAPGTIPKLGPGEEFQGYSPNRPNSALDGFMRYMLREVAAGVGVSYESLSRDYSQSNYSSSRLALLDDRDLWRVLQQWWVRSFREPLLRDWMQAAVLSGAIPSISVEQWALDPERFLEVTWKLRGWSWVDPTKEVDAYRQAVMSGFMTVSQVISMTSGGLDIEDVIAERKRELAMFDEAEIEVDTTVPEPVELADPTAPVSVPVADPPSDAADAADAEDPEDAAPARVLKMRAKA